MSGVAVPIPPRDGIVQQPRRTGPAWCLVVREWAAHTGNSIGLRNEGKRVPFARTFKMWDVGRGHPTPESVFLHRRQFLKLTGICGLPALGLSACRPNASAGTGADDTADLLADTTRSVPGSAFRKGPRNEKFQVDRPTTDERIAAQYNNFYEFGVDKEKCWRAAQRLSTRPWTIDITGLVKRPMRLDIDELIRRMPCEERLYRVRCVERWAMVVPWSGFPFRALLKLVEPLSSATFVRFVSFLKPDEAVGQSPGSGWKWPYYEGLTMAEAANELTFAATGLYGHDIPKQHGAPLRMVIPWKYGYKGAKSVVKIEFVDQQPHTFWNDYAPQEYGFYSNVNPDKPHPRWSQKRETMIGTNEGHDTQAYNGYADFVADLYTGKEH